MSRDTVLIVGGAGSIGLPTAHLYVEKGHNVIVADIDSGKEDEMASVGIQYEHVDITSPQSIRDLAHRIGSQGSIEHVINVAGRALRTKSDSGMNEFCTIEDLSDETIDYSINLNLSASVRILRTFTPLLLASPQENRSFALVSDINAIRDYGLAPFSAARAGLVGLMRATATDLGDRGIRCNIVLVGSIESPVDHQGETLARLKTASAYGGRLSRPEEVAKGFYAVTHDLFPAHNSILTLDFGQAYRSIWSRTDEKNPVEKPHE